MADDGPLKIWNDVPDRSTLAVSVTSSNPTFACSAIFVSDDARMEKWSDADLNPGPKRRMLSQTAEGYTATILITFDGDDEAPVEIRAQINGPGGEPFDGPYFHAVSGKTGDILHATLIVKMELP
jgi:hypothetical protein